jgi:hypothetical protein
LLIPTRLFWFASKEPSTAPEHRTIWIPNKPRAISQYSVPFRRRSREQAGKKVSVSGEGKHRSRMLELLLVGCSGVVVLLHGASFFLRALFSPRHAVARPVRFVPCALSGSPRDRAEELISLFPLLHVPAVTTSVSQPCTQVSVTLFCVIRSHTHALLVVPLLVRAASSASSPDRRDGRAMAPGRRARPGRPIEAVLESFCCNYGKRRPSFNTRSTT